MNEVVDIDKDGYVYMDIRVDMICIQIQVEISYIDIFLWRFLKYILFYLIRKIILGGRLGM